MDLCQEAQAFVLAALGKGHGHRVGVERKPEHAGAIQKTPHDAAPPLAAHEPFEIGLLVIAGQFVALVGIGLGAFLAADVEGVVAAHGRNLCAPLGGTGTLAATHQDGVTPAAGQSAGVFGPGRPVLHAEAHVGFQRPHHAGLGQRSGLADIGVAAVLCEQ